MSKTYLRECPFCGSDKIECASLQFTIYFVTCRRCNIDGPTKDTERKAINAWNRRAVKYRILPGFTKE